MRMAREALKPFITKLAFESQPTNMGQDLYSELKHVDSAKIDLNRNQNLIILKIAKIQSKVFIIPKPTKIST